MTQPALEDLTRAFPLVERVLERARLTPIRTLATAESCTGGLLAAALTAVPGSSAFYRGGVVTYANSLKTSELGVSTQLLELHGAVSPEVAEAMALGVRERFRSTLGVSTTGIAGPGGTGAKPAGLIYLAVASEGETTVRRLDHDRGRHGNRVYAVHAALELILAALQ